MVIEQKQIHIDECSPNVRLSKNPNLPNIRHYSESDIILVIKELMGDDSNVAFAKKVGMSEAGLRQILKGSPPNYETMKKIARAGNVSVEYLVSGGKSNALQKAEDDTLYIEAYPDVRGAAGCGQCTPTDQVVIKVAVNASEWRNYVGLDYKHIKLITVYGDSMVPTLYHGDQIMVDTAIHRFIDDSIYCIQQGDMIRIKRIKLKLDGSIEVRSDNAAEGFNTETYSSAESDAFKVIGKVIPFKFGRFDF